MICCCECLLGCSKIMHNISDLFYFYKRKRSVEDDIESMKFWVPQKSISFDSDTVVSEIKSIPDVINDIESNHDQECNTNVLSPTEDENIYFGVISFEIFYDSIRSILAIHLDRISNMPSRDKKITYNTFVRISLISHKNVKMSTLCKLIEKQDSRKILSYLEPIYNQNFDFPIHKVKLNHCLLRLTAFDSYRFNRNDPLGYALLDLSLLLSNDSNMPLELSLPLNYKSLPINIDGFMLISLSYNFDLEKLVIGILRCRDIIIKASKSLFRKQNNEKIEVFLKVVLMCSGEKIKCIRSKTMATGEKINLVFNQNFYYFVPSKFIYQTSIIVSIYAKDRIKSDYLIGKIRSGPFISSSDNTVTHWGRMLKESRPVTEWRRLYI